jgi:hypothetical protein
VLVAAVVNMVLGTIWYMPSFFGKGWMKEMGKKDGDMKAEPGPLVAMFVIALAIGYLMAHFVSYTNAMGDFWMGAETGLWAALAFRVLPSASGTVAARGSWNLWAINNGYWVVALMLMGGVIAAM